MIQTKERITILGKTTPNYDPDLKAPLLCTTGINQRGEWRRLYPIPVESYPLIRSWNVVEVVLLRAGKQLPNTSHRDYRPESRVVNVSSLEPLRVVGTVSKTNEKLHLIKRLLCPSEEWLKEQRNPRRTIGIVKPMDWSIRVLDSSQKKAEDEDIQTLLNYSDPVAKRNDEKRRLLEQRLMNYYRRFLDVKMRFRCEYNDVCPGHEKNILDDGIHQFIKNEFNKCHDLDTVKVRTLERMEDGNQQSWIFLGLGTINGRPFTYTIGSVFRLPKSKISASTIDSLDPRKANLVTYLRKKEPQARTDIQLKDKGVQRKLFDQY